MRPRQVMRRVAFAAALSLSACGGSKGGTGDPPPGAPPFSVGDLRPTDGGSLATAEQSLADGARGASGIRELLGASAADTFGLLGGARAAAQAEAVLALEAWAAGPTTAARPVALVFGASAAQATSAGWFEVPVAVTMLAGMQPLFVVDSGATPAVPAELTTARDSTTDGVTSHFENHVAVAGSKVESTFSSSQTTTAPNGTTITETITITVATDPCPDPGGGVPMRIAVRTRSSAGTRGYDYGLDVRATGHVAEDGSLAGYRMDARADITLAPGNALVPRGDGMFVEYVGGESAAGLDGGTFTLSDFDYVRTRASSRVDETFARDTFKELLQWARIYVLTSLRTSEQAWLGGRCVELVAEGLKAPFVESDQDTVNRIVPDGERLFTARVRHRFERIDLVVDVGAALESGATAVAPAGSPVPAPALFAYRAGPAEAQDAVVALTSRSRRGGAKLRVAFQTSCNPAGNLQLASAGALVGARRAALAAACIDAWAGTSAVVVNAPQLVSTSATAQVTWTYSAERSSAERAVYEPSGTFTLVRYVAGNGCTVAPQSRPIGPADGMLEVDYGAGVPQQHFGYGQADFLATQTCGEISFEAPVSVVWFHGGGGSVSADGLRITGTGTGDGNPESWSYAFSRQ